MNFYNILCLLTTILMTKGINYTLCQSCDEKWKNFQTGMASFDIEIAKDTLLTKSGYITDNAEPFTSVFKLNEKYNKNINDLFLKSEKLLHGTQKILDDYFGKYTNQPKPNTTNIKEFLDASTECIPRVIRCPYESLNIKCDPSEKYRSFDGSCNNLGKPYQGAAFTHYSRIDDFVTFYDDNIREIRKSITGENLISPRIITNEILLKTHNTKQCSKEIPNMGWLLFGQVITHDIAGSINNVHEKTERTNDPPIRCCTQDYKNILPSSKMHSSCLPFSIPNNDQYHEKTYMGCHNYIRTKTTLSNNCQLEPAQQVTRVSHYPDLSVIYGSSEVKSEKLRTGEHGKLLTSDGDLLPKRNKCTGGKCYYSGDFRALQVPPLGFLHLIFVRLHNIIAENLKNHKPMWSDEKIFQEARRLNIAIYENIIYMEYLPILLGENIKIDTVYNSSTDGSTSNDFNTGAFRQLHWFTPKAIELYKNGCNITHIRRKTNNKKYIFFVDGVLSIPYGKMIFDPTDYFQDNLEALQRTITEQPINMAKIEEEIANKLFNQTDLLSVDIQRGRDHGLAPYWKYRELCGFKPIKSFEDLSPLISEDDVYHLTKMYKSPYDIDLYVGGGLEQKNCDDIIGPTMKCLTKLQFERFKNGDRFFYTNNNLSHSLPKNLIEAIKKVTFSSVLCSTTNMAFISKNSFLVPSPTNEMLPCSKINIPDFIDELTK
ncbi:peroxidase-like [Condylostylus longicornis]|uniref:peroxidase-like n=1 Tax=Condylostylus longicornis TaxID=2530218 RepID=UPI00244DDD68|nr:peroxidase-like [Condylostylus longicornis]